MSNNRVINFSGMEWIVKARDSLMGPGPNYFSDNDENVWVDQKGQLHLKLTYDGEKWNCAEVMSLDYVKYGNYTIYIKGRPDELDPNLIFSTFMYQYINDQHEPEIDIEFSYWGDREYRYNTSYSLHNFSQLVYNKEFETSLKSDKLTCQIGWSAKDISFRVNKGHNKGKCYLKTIDEARYSESNAFSAEHIPKESDQLRLHINLWILGGKALIDQKKHEIVIKKIEID